MFCDFTNGVKMLAATAANIAISEDQLILDDPPPDSPPPHRPGYPGPSRPGRGPSTPYAQYNRWSFARAASWHHHNPDSRVILHPSYMVTLYDPKYRSLEANHKLPVIQHRLIDISPEDIKTFEAEVSEALYAWRDDQDGQLGSGIDWRSIAQAVVERNADRLSEMRELLGNVSSSTNITAAISTARVIAFALVMPYVDYPSVLSINATEDGRAHSLIKATKQCTFAFTGHLDALSIKMTSQEHGLKSAVEGVLTRICAFATGTLGHSLAILQGAQQASELVDHAAGLSALEAWKNELQELMEWLGWAAWQRCPRVCDWDVRISHFVPIKLVQSSNYWVI